MFSVFVPSGPYEALLVCIHACTSKVMKFQSSVAYVSMLPCLCMLMND